MSDPLPTPLLLQAYRLGVFPMAVGPDQRIGWFSPDPRAIIPLDDRFHISHSLRRTLKKVVIEDAPPVPLPAAPRFLVTINRAFRDVIRECSIRDEGTWISPAIIRAYTRLHEQRHAHSVEVWRLPPNAPPKWSPQLKLAGGLYGVAIGGAFFGESMFHRETDASKIALVALVERLRARRFILLDTQWLTPHLARFGAYEIPRAEYLRLLARATGLQRQFD
ncbi:MAG: leucyl/phenylalanyl-tRNA--protein transferase [Verrucomicrobiae bacterium]|nr:leucyl/phenylalanyl-tRNA--protein transferase [Verrucomicrobiae bacterium]MDW8343963.1 leucyl/phenylalanyl-tRNA--protein transferase [Verrucomicrobiae bacterium]